MSSDIIYVVMDGQYEPSLEAVFSSAHEEAAKRYAAALRDGFCYSMLIDSMVQDIFYYKIDYDLQEDTALVWLSPSEWCDVVEVTPGGFYIAYVEALTHAEAERLGKARIYEYLGMEVGGDE